MVGTLVHPVELLQHLIRFDTTNPPGNEVACIGYVNDLLRAAGFETTILARDPNRPNLITRLAGEGSAPPLLLYGHVDVVTTEGQRWTHPPFSGALADGYVWGRGALDMKGGVAILVSAVLRAAAEGIRLPGDVILCLVSDEEAGGDFGARFLVEQHPDLFEGVCYALGEFGGFSLTISGKPFYLVMVAEKQGCRVRLTARSAAGHGSMPMRGAAMARLARVITTLDRGRLPVHITPVAREMCETLTGNLPFPAGLMMGQLLNPALTNRVLDLMGERGRLFDPLLHNTVSPTIIRGGDKINVIPAEVTLDLDMRLLPGFTPEVGVQELRGLIGDDVEIEVSEFSPGTPAPNMGLFDTLAGILREADPDAIPLPYMLSGGTDGRFFARLGIQTYGFLPMKLPAEFNFAQTIHAADERIPVGALEFGTSAILKAMQRFGG